MDNRHLYDHLNKIVVTVLILGFNGNSYSAIPNPQFLKDPQAPLPKETSSFVVGECIVKFEDNADQPVFADSIKIQSIKPLFPMGDSPEGSTRLDQRLKNFKIFVQQIKERFKSRAQRAPRSISLPNLAAIYIVTFSADADQTVNVCRDLENDKNVEYSHPNYLIKINQTQNVTAKPLLLNYPNDPYFYSSGSWNQPYHDLWNLKKINNELAWQKTKGLGTIVAVIDRGVDYNHKDIQKNIWINSREIPNNGIDDDQNGFVDDVRGWEFFYGTNDPLDRYGHGTHVAGTIASVGNNSIGIIGVAPEAQIMTIKAFDDSGNSTTDLLTNAIKYAVDNGADVLNNSWACFAVCPNVATFTNIIQYAYGLGAVIVFAAGNTDSDVITRSPQNLPETIVVAASDELDQKAHFSNYGTKIDVSAPGNGSASLMEENILSLKSAQINPSMSGSNNQFVVGTEYLRSNGTSMSAPHVSGLAALLLAQNPSLTIENVRQIIRSSSDDIDAPGFDVETGHGRINVFSAINYSKTPLDVFINTPRPAALFNSNAPITILGTAAGPNFKQYILSYGDGLNPSQWTQINISSNPVVNGLLGVWNIAQLKTNYYTLKLEAQDNSGAVYDTYVTVILEESVTPFLTSPIDEWYFDISGYNIVWEMGTTNSDIYYCQLNPSTLQCSNPIQITTNPAEQAKPAISGNTIVWQDERQGRDQWDIWFCKFNSQTNTCPEVKVTSHIQAQTDPDIDGNTIVWQDQRFCSGYYCGTYSPYEWVIFSCTINSLGFCGNEQQITPFKTRESQARPKISGLKIVWEDSRSYPVNSIRMYDLATSQETVLDAGTYLWRPYIEGNYVVWVEENLLLSPQERNLRIIFYDLLIQQKQAITNFHHGYQEWISPKVSNKGKIVWEDYRIDNASVPYNDIYLYDITSQKEQAIAPYPDAVGNFPAISGDLIIWADSRNTATNGWDLFLYNSK